VRRRGAAGCFAAALVAFAPAGCGGDDDGPERRLIQATAIEEQLTREMGARVRAIVDLVACPEDVPAVPGRSFECAATFDGEPDPVVARLVDASGRRASFRLKNLLLGRLEMAVQQRFRGARVAVTSADCPGPVPQARGRVSFCTVEVGGRLRRVRVRQLDANGNVRLTFG